MKAYLTAATLIAAFSAVLLRPTCAVAADLPLVNDARLKLQLVAAEPDVVTPTGIAVDAQGRVLVIESHTHFRPEGYEGPPHDRIRLLEDADGDGRAERVSTFFEGTKHTMNLAVYHDGSVYVATRAEVFRLRDADNDGRADERTRIAHLETPGDYPHNGLSGFAFDHRGDVYFGFGENLGADYQLIGSDGKALAGGGEGGNIYRCRPDGSELALVATGFWNPFHLCFDAFGRLFAVDNDPDSRPPCRLLHIVEGGDYGYRFRNGRKGLHPFTSWNGELPGTLPMVAGTGEAPSGMLAYESDQFPHDYRGDLLVTSWGDHRIERYRLIPRGASLAAEMRPVVSGGESFRPVGIAAAPDGSIYFSDWVDKSYQLHGQGRVWKLSAANPPDVVRSADPESALLAADWITRANAARQLAAKPGDGGQAVRQALASTNDPRVQATAVLALDAADELNAEDVETALDSANEAVQALAVQWGGISSEELKSLALQKHSPTVRAAALAELADNEAIAVLLEALNDGDPFVRHAAAQGLMRTAFDAQDADWKSFKSPHQRAAAALLLRRSAHENRLDQVPQLLRDPDPMVRFLAVQWIAEEGLRQYRDQLEQTLATADTRLLFQACLAALERLDGGSRKAGDEWSGDDYAARIVADPAAASQLRLNALRAIRADHPSLTRELLEEFLGAAAALRLEAIRTLRESPHADLLLDVAKDEARPDQERASAVVGILPLDGARQEMLVDLACGESALIAQEALRSLRGAELSAKYRQRLADKNASAGEAWRELAARVLHKTPHEALPPAGQIDDWLDLLQGDADVAAGERIFFHAGAAGCFRCHEVNGRGSAVGPNLTGAGRTFTRRRLLESILQPSREIAPLFTPWMVATVDGRVFTGLHVGTDNEGVQRYLVADGGEIEIATRDIEERRPSPESIMPQKLAESLTLQELRDLLAFLESSK